MLLLIHYSSLYTLQTVLLYRDIELLCWIVSKTLTSLSEGLYSITHVRITLETVFFCLHDHAKICNLNVFSFFPCIKGGKPRFRLYLYLYSLRRAVELCFALITKDNIETLLTEILALLETAPEELKVYVVSNIFPPIERYLFNYINHPHYTRYLLLDMLLQLNGTLILC